MTKAVALGLGLALAVLLSVDLVWLGGILSVRVGRLLRALVEALAVWR